MLNIGIVSYEHPHVFRYVPAFNSHPDARVTKICGIGANLDRAKQDAEDMGCDFFDTLKEAFFRDLDAIYLATAPSRHKEIVKTSSEKGVHILLDKPIALSMEEADEIIDIAETNGIKLMVPFTTRWQPAVRKAKELLRGNIHYVYAVKMGMNPANIKNFDSSWFFDHDKAGFGGFGDIAMHMIDAIRFLIGSDAVSVYAKMSEGDLYGEAMIEFKGGAFAYIMSGWTKPFGKEPWTRATLEILSDNSVVLINKPLYEPISDYCISREGAHYLDLGREDIVANINEFISSIIEDRTPAITGEDAKAVLNIVLAAYRSDHIRRKILL